MAEVERTDRAPVVRGDVARENIAAIARLQERATRERSFFARMGDRITIIAAGEWFLLGHVVWFASWFAINSGLIPLVPSFDRFPFPLLTVLVSLDAIFLTLLVLGSQNRLTQEADQRAHLDLQVNLLAEQEMTMVLRMLREICEHLGLEDTISSPKFQELVKRTDVTQLAEQLATHLPPSGNRAASATGGGTEPPC